MSAWNFLNASPISSFNPSQNKEENKEECMSASKG